MIIRASNTNTGKTPKVVFTLTGKKRDTRALVRVGLVGAAYFFLTAFFTFPLVLNFSAALPGQLIEDRDQNLWNLWWVKESILHLRNPFQTDYIYYPDGVSLYFHTLNPLNGLISLPVQLIFGTVAAYNFIVFFSFVMAGIGSYLLLVHITGHRAASFCASLIYVFAPYHIGTLKGIMQLISLEWLPFYILFLLRATSFPLSDPLTGQTVALGWWRNRWRDLGAASLFLVLTALTDWYYTLFLIGFTLVYLLWQILAATLAPFALTWPLRWDRKYKNGITDKGKRLLPDPDSGWLSSPSPFVQSSLTGLPTGNGKHSARSVLINIVVPGVSIVGLFLLAVSPLLLAMFKEMSATTYYLPDPNDTLNFSADLLAMFVPPTTSTLFGDLSANVLTAHDLTGPLAAQVFLGYLPVGFAVLGLVVATRSRFWGFCGLLFAILSLGPALRINGPQPGWWLPYTLIENLPVIKIMRSPDRFIVITMLCLAVCACYGLRWLIEAFYRRWPRMFKTGPGHSSIPGLSRPGILAKQRFGLVKRLSVPTVLSLLLFAENLQVPYPVNAYRVSSFFEQLGQDPSDYSLLELPPQAGYWSGADRMAEQAVHHKRIFDGYISREYDHPFQSNTPGFRELTTLKFGQEIVLPSPGQGQVQNQESSQVSASLTSIYASFSYYRVRYIILRLPANQKQANSVNLDDYRAAIGRVAPGNPIYTDSQIEVFAVPQKAVATHQPFLEINGTNWYAAEPNAAEPGHFHRWSSGPAGFNLVWEGPGSREGEFSLTLGTLQDGRPAEISFDGKVVWSGDLNNAPRKINLPLLLAPGKHQIMLDVQGKAKRPLSLGIGDDTRALLFYAQDVSFQ